MASVTLSAACSQTYRVEVRMPPTGPKRFQTGPFIPVHVKKSMCPEPTLSQPQKTAGTNLNTQIEFGSVWLNFHEKKKNHKCVFFLK